MDGMILLFSFLILMFLGIPVAYAMGLATLITALWIDIPLEAVMLKISDGMDDFALLTILTDISDGADAALPCDDASHHRFKKQGEIAGGERSGNGRVGRCDLASTSQPFMQLPQ